MARILHLAVNLFLIAAVCLHPALAAAISQSCAIQTESGFACQGCGCCTVAVRDAKCGCCCPWPAAAEPHGDCCGHKGPSDAGEQPQPATKVGGRVSASSVTSRPAPARPSSDPPEATPVVRLQRLPTTAPSSQSAMTTGCDCLTSPEVPRAPLPGSTGVELRDVGTTGTPISAVASAAAAVACTSLRSDRTLASPLDDTQSAFCVWRL